MDGKNRGITSRSERGRGLSEAEIRTGSLPGGRRPCAAPGGLRYNRRQKAALLALSPSPILSPLSGRRVALVHPAWHSCGTYRVVLGQIAAYRALGAQVFPIAVSSDPGFRPERRWIWREFAAATPELNDGPRFFGGAPFRAVLAPRFLKDVLWPYLHGDQAVIRSGLAERALLSPGLEDLAFDLVHCNHFFLMPVAKRLAREEAKILLDSHDLQARQFALMNEHMPWLKPHVTYDAMLAQELAHMREADLLIHLNAREEDEFRAALPEKTHALLYPAVPPAPTGPGGDDIVIVSSNNSANVDSVIWFLREVAPRAPRVTVKIAGNVDAGVRARDAALFERYRGWFLGRVEDPAAVYAGARLALLPTVGGHGLSIKTVEAMASGLPLIATRLALRGMGEGALELEGVTLADAPEEFAAALSEASRAPAWSEEQRKAGASRAYYEAHFSAEAYERNLAALVVPLL
jgi:glycosyltransferase involved in cell wall biosynthesis